jgi:hypothetical protein
MTRSAVQNMTNQELYKILIDIDTSDLFGNDVSPEEAVEKIETMTYEEKLELLLEFMENAGTLDSDSVEDIIEELKKLAINNQATFKCIFEQGSMDYEYIEPEQLLEELKNIKPGNCQLLNSSEEFGNGTCKQAIQTAITARTPGYINVWQGDNDKYMMIEGEDFDTLYWIPGE